MHVDWGVNPVSQISVRAVPGDILEALRQEAKETHMSLNSIIVNALEEHVRRRARRLSLARHLPDFRSFKEEVLTRRHGQPTSESAELVHEDRRR